MMVKINRRRLSFAGLGAALTMPAIVLRNSSKPHDSRVDRLSGRWTS
jgi:hypothetical protein